MKIEGFRYLDADYYATAKHEDMDIRKRMERCVTISYELDTETHILTMGFALRSPLDVHNKHLGKKIAFGRRKKLGRFSVKATLKEEETIKQVSARVLNDLTSKAAEWFPKWAKDRDGKYFKTTLVFNGITKKANGDS